MVCRLCLNESEASIDIFSKEEIKEYISRFLQLELTPEDPISKVMCAMCWLELENFQTFCLRVELAQKGLSTVQKDIKMEASDIGNNPYLDYSTDGADLKAMNERCSASIAEDSTLDTKIYQLFDIVEIQKEEIIEPSIFTALKTNEYSTTPEMLHEVVRPKDHPPEEIAITVKKKRRPRRKPAEIANIEKIPSERTKKLLETSKKFDKIIKDHMTLLCDICNTELVDFAELKLHFRRAHNCKGYVVCCSKRMHKRHLVVDHITTHDGTSYICDVCGKNASSRDALRSHLKYVHLTKREFQCTFCDKAFKKALDLREHTANHTGEVLYTCPHCPKTFTSRATMHGHRKEKHRAEWEANKRCSYF